MKIKILRIFPRKTKATPIDENVIINRMPNLFDEADQINISVAFTWDIPRAEQLAYAWQSVAPVTIGGPALNQIGGEFEPGMYLKEGYVITSRGCNNRCWFCSVWKREPIVKELSIKHGWNVCDDNLLACSYNHIQRVFKMLYKQNHPISLTGGIEAKLLRPWHIDLFTSIQLKELFCAYDTDDDYEPLIEAGKLLKQANITLENRKARCYVLIGYPKDTISDALKRIYQTINAGFFPFAMLWRNEKGEFKHEWKQFQREWANPFIIATNIKKIKKHGKIYKSVTH
jgi:hypothetical protein